MTLGYDATALTKLLKITDAAGAATTLSYYPDSDYGPDCISKVTDPFGRVANFQYNNSGQLIGITDPAGITSQFAYAPAAGTPNYDATLDPNFIVAMTTPYGTTNFSTSNDGNVTAIQATDPLGGVERAELRDGAPLISATDSAAPTGFSAGNQNLNIGNTYYWDKKAMQVTGTGALDYTKAVITHWLLSADGTVLSGVPASVKPPLENRVWYQYPGQADLLHAGTIDSPSLVARVLDSGSTQLYQYAYNALGNPTETIDPLGRTTSFVYDSSNNIDLTEVHQTTGGMDDLLAKFTYYPNHLVETAQDASKETTSYTYNTSGQLLTVTDPKSETTTFAYGSGSTSPDYQRVNLITGPISSDTTSFAYDSQGRVATVTDSEGYAITYGYDVSGTNPLQTLDRISKISYPDGTYRQILYNNLDAEWMRDRLGRWTHATHDALRNLHSVTDPAGRTITYNWCNCGALESIQDANGNVTTWCRDLESRVTAKVFADTSHIGYTYESASGRLSTATDALNQVTTYSYNLDDTPASVQYTSTVHSTPNVSFTYDPNYNRVATMTDGIGTTTYSYNPITSGVAPGAGRLSSIQMPMASGTGTPTIQYTYDELGRVTSHSIDSVAESGTFDALGRITSGSNALGAFHYGYVDATERLSSGTYPNGQVTHYAYYGGTSDPLLKTIENLNPSSAVISRFDYSYDSAGRIQNWKKYQNASPNASQYAFGYDGSDWLTDATVSTLSGTTGSGTVSNTLHYGYDSAGNRRSEQMLGKLTSWTPNSVNQLTAQNGGNTLHVAGTVSQASDVSVSGSGGAAVYAPVDGNLNFQADVPVSGGSNTITVTATSGTATQVNRYGVNVTQGVSNTFAYDAAGNLTASGTLQTCEWDAENRLTAINTGTTQRTEFAYNGLGQRVRIVEKSGTSVLSTKQLVWEPGAAQPSQERDASNNVTKRYFAQGVQIITSGTPANYYYTFDHLGSIREMVDSSGTVQAQYDYRLYGHKIKLAGSMDADFGYAGYYYHQPSGLNLTLYRAYNSDLGRWISRDPIGERGGINLYGYVSNNPLAFTDPLGLWTFGVGITGIAGFIGPGGTLSGGIYVGHREGSPWYSGWSFGLLGTGGGGALAGAGGSVSVFAGWTNNSSVCKLKGGGWDIGASGGEGVNAGGDVTGPWSSPNNPLRGPTGGSLSLGFSVWVPLPYPGEGHGFVTNTVGWTWGSTQ